MWQGHAIWGEREGGNRADANLIYDFLNRNHAIDACAVHHRCCATQSRNDMLKKEAPQRRRENETCKAPPQHLLHGLLQQLAGIA